MTITAPKGTDVAAGFAIETTPGTREAPDTWVRIVNESMTRQVGSIRSRGMGAGRRLLRARANGTETNGGSILQELGGTELASMLRAIVGGNPSPTGSGPYVRSFAGLGELPAVTWQIQKPMGGGGAVQPFDFVRCYCNAATITQNPNAYAELQTEWFAGQVLTDQSAGTFAAPADEELFTFDQVVITPFGGSAICADSWSLNVRNNLVRQPKVCADGAVQEVQYGDLPVISGVITDDFEDLTNYGRYVAGDEGTLTFVYTGDNASILSIALRVWFTGETPAVGGPGTVKQGLPFEVVSGTSDADALTITLTNPES